MACRARPLGASEASARAQVPGAPRAPHTAQSHRHPHAHHSGTIEGADGICQMTVDSRARCVCVCVPNVCGTGPACASTFRFSITIHILVGRDARRAPGGESQGRGGAVPLGYVDSACPWELGDDQGTNRKLSVSWFVLRRYLRVLRTHSFLFWRAQSPPSAGARTFLDP